MNPNAAAANPSTSTARRLWRGIFAAASVAIVGTAALPAAQADAAGVKTTAYAVVKPATTSATVSPSALPVASERSITYRVGQDGKAHRI